MARKPTNEDLLKRVGDLDADNSGVPEIGRIPGEQEGRYYDLVEESNIPVIIHGEEEFVYLNPAAVRILGGRSREDFLGKPVWDFFHDESREFARKRIRELFENKGRTGKLETRFLRLDGEVIDVEVTGNYIEYMGRPSCEVVLFETTRHKRAERALERAYREMEQKVEERTAELEKSNLLLRHEIEERKQAEEALRDREEALKAILGAPPIGIGLAQDRIIKWGNRALHRMLGYEDGTLSGRDLRLVYPDEEEYERAGWALYPTVKEKGIGNVETRWVTKSGRVVDCYVQVSPLDPRDHSKGVIVSVLDITDRKRAEEHIHTLTQELMKAQENERQVISRELHDRVAQDLSSLKIACETLFDNQPEVSPVLKGKVSEISRTLHGTIMAVRDLSYDLRPPGLDELGLVETISQYCEDFSERSGIKVTFTSAGMDGLRLGFDPEINFYRLMQEGLNNIWRHADAKRASVSMVAAFPNVFLRITDDGKGFDVKKRMATMNQEKRMGLRSMEERVRLLQGKMTIQSQPMQGTRISIKIPFKEKIRGSEEYNTDS